MKEPLRTRKPTRLPEYDYARPGAYFITICTHGRECVLGEVSGEEMILSKEGEIVHQVRNYCFGRIESFATGREKPSPTPERTHGVTEVVRAFKTFSSRRINEYRKRKGIPFWQRSFYDHVIQDEIDLHNHRRYIQENPLKWTLDELYTEKIICRATCEGGYKPSPTKTVWLRLSLGRFSMFQPDL